MTDEHKLIRDAALASQAQSLIDNDLLKEAFAELERAYVERWRATHIDDAAGREKLFIAVNVVGKVRDHLNAILSNGKLAEAELKQIADTAERKKRFGII